MNKAAATAVHATMPVKAPLGHQKPSAGHSSNLFRSAAAAAAGPHLVLASPHMPIDSTDASSTEATSNCKCLSDSLGRHLTTTTTTATAESTAAAAAAVPNLYFRLQ